MIHDLSTLEGQRAHYAAVRARLTCKPRVENLALGIKARVNRDAQRRDATYRMIARREMRDTRLRLESERLARIADRVGAGEVFVPRLTIREIAQQVSDASGFSLAEICSASRHSNLVVARQFVFWRARHETLLSFPQIGRAIGDRDHTTAIHGYHKIAAMMREGTVPACLLATIPRGDA